MSLFDHEARQFKFDVLRAVSYTHLDVYKRQAASIAAKLHAENMILVSDIPGLLRNPEDEGSLIPRATLSEIEELKKDGVISGGMIPKVDCLVTAVQGSVQRAVIIDGRVPHSILIEMFSEEGIGTLVEE